jgi:hypothetical protein
MTAPLTFELQREPCPGLADLGDEVELRELSYGALRRAMAQASETSGVGDAVLAASLHVDGEPLGLAGLDALPGRLSMAIANALTRCLELHGLTSAKPRAADDAQDEGVEETAPGEA